MERSLPTAGGGAGGNCLDLFANQLCNRVLRGCCPERPAPSTPAVEATSAAVSQLLDEFQQRRNGLTLVDSAAEALRQLAELSRILHWDEGLRDALHDLVLATIEQAERFGDKAGPFKRRFSIDTITRVLRAYDESGLIVPVEDVLLAPVVGIEIDWMVEALNIHNAWQPVPHVKLPRLLHGRYGSLLRLHAKLWRCWEHLVELLFAPSQYERQLRDARRHIDQEVRALYAVLPTDSWHGTSELIVNVVADIGQLTAPHVQTVDLLWQLAAELQAMSIGERQEVVFRATRSLLRRAYAEDPLPLVLLDSALGQFLIRQLVLSTEWVLRRNRLLPQAV